ncbi:MAG: hypothetical protein JHC84_19610 [Solirubrobacteraceae bacterium]|nr:hypothetical protein [Solirubrobacteraceae bacterium]
MSATLPRRMLPALVTTLTLALPATAFAGISVPLPPPSLKATASGPAQGPVIPATDRDGKLVLCREDEEAQMSICIPWPQG